ncbi:MAG: hypothetical protein IPK82_13300 [Polyangiaceae bacterium]|nr:hypothetical protein [Polyangiaceae bacterium]
MTGTDLKATLTNLFDAERKIRELNDVLTQSAPGAVLEVVNSAIADARQLQDEDESALRLVRLADVLSYIEGPQAIDALIDILASDSPEGRVAAGEAIESIAFERFKEVAQGVERALKRLPEGSPALPEIPYILSDVPEPGVIKLIEMFLKHKDADAVAAAIEVAADISDPALTKHLAALVNDKRRVDMADEESDEASEVSIGELAQEALDIIGDNAGDEDDEEGR